MLISHRGSTPSVDPSAFVAPTATLVGDVRVGPRARIMYGAVLDAEGSSVSVGEACVIAEHAVLHARTTIAAEAFVGPSCVAVGEKIFRPDQTDEIAQAIRGIDFAGAAF